MVKRKSTKG